MLITASQSQQFRHPWAVTFSYCNLENAIAYLREQYAVGTVEIRIVKSSPKNNGANIRS
jgi:hypothetical protein